MSRSHATRQLLKLGPLTFRELLEITGWTRMQARDVLGHLLEREEVKRITERGTHRFLYGLAA